VTDVTLSTSYKNVPSRCAPCIECPYGQQTRDQEKFVYLNGDILIASKWKYYVIQWVAEIIQLWFQIYHLGHPWVTVARQSDWAPLDLT
jgi:hypothetical protein